MLALLCALAPPAHADDSRIERIREAVATTGVYLEPGTAMGEVDLWTTRLTAALDRVRLGVPVRVALWTPIPGLEPATEGPEAEPQAVRRQLGLTGGVALTNWLPEAGVDDTAVQGETLRRVRALDLQVDAIEDALVSASDDPERYRNLTPVARAWIWLRLAAQEVPKPRGLVAELSGDRSLLADGAVPPDIEDYYADEDSDLVHPLAIATALLVLLGTAALFMLRWRRDRETQEREEAPLERSAYAAGLTDLHLEQEVADLAEAIAASEVAPGDRDYDRAQAHLDAAARFVDSQLDRERVGCHLLVQDGHVLLAGKTVPARCFFHPEHYSEASVGKGKVRVPCCLQCAAAVRAGKRPPALVVADARGKLAPYYDTHDVWTRTGFGSLPGNWAKRALLDSLTRAVGR